MRTRETAVLLVVMAVLMAAFLMSVLPRIASGSTVHTEAIGFVNKWTRAVGDGTNPISEAQSITVATGTNDLITLFVRTHDCDTATGITFGVTDNGGNAYTVQFTNKRANCGTVDDQMWVWSASNAGATTNITVTRTGGTPNDHFTMGFIVQTYSGAGLIGAKASGSPNTAFPEMFIVSSTVSRSWAVAYNEFFGNPTMPPGGYNAGTFRANVTGTPGGFPSMGSDNRENDNGTSGSGRVCASTEVCIYPNLSGSVSMTFFIMEILPPMSPPVVVTIGADADQFGSSVVLKGRLADIDAQNVVAVFFQYGKDVGFGNETAHANVITAQDFSASLTLVVATNYFFRACVSNATATYCGSTLAFHTGFDLVALMGLITFVVFMVTGSVFLYSLARGKRKGGGMG